MIPMYRLMWLSDPSDYVTPFRTTDTLYSTWVHGYFTTIANSSEDPSYTVRKGGWRS